MQSIFLNHLEQDKSGKILNEEVKHILKDLIDLVQPNKNETYILPPFVQRRLNDFESFQFDLEANSYTNPIIIGSRLNKDYNIYLSKTYNRTGASRRNCSIKYLDNDEVKFANVNYYLQVEEMIYACIEEFDIISNNFMFNYRGYLNSNLKELKDLGCFENIYYLVKEKGDLSLINSFQIKTKCIMIQNDEDTFYISEFINENEHD